MTKLNRGFISRFLKRRDELHTKARSVNIPEKLTESDYSKYGSLGDNVTTQQLKEEDELLAQVWKEVMSSIDDDDYIDFDISEDDDVDDGNYDYVTCEDGDGYEGSFWVDGKEFKSYAVDNTEFDEWYSNYVARGLKEDYDKLDGELVTEFKLNYSESEPLDSRIYQKHPVWLVLDHTRDENLITYLAYGLEEYFNRRHKVITELDYDGLDVDNDYLNAQRDNRLFDFLYDDRVLWLIRDLSSRLDGIITELYEKDNESGSIRNYVHKVSNKK